MTVMHECTPMVYNAADDTYSLVKCTGTRVLVKCTGSHTLVKCTGPYA